MSPATAAADTAAAAEVMTDVSFVDIFMLFCQTVHVGAETVVNSRLQGRYVSVCVICAVSQFRASIRNVQTTQNLILGVSGRVCVVE